MSTSTQQVAIGDVRELELCDGLTRTQIVMYAGASGDYNPLHTDEPYATGPAGFPSVFAHGMLVMGMAGRLLTDWFGPDQLVKYGVRFARQVWPGDTLTARAEVKDIRDEDGARLVDLEFVVTNQEDQAVTVGSATARVQP